MSITRSVTRLVTRPISRAVTESIGGFSLGDLFPAATSGWAYDFWDTTKIYTDTAGTTPVTAVDQTIARVNDKSGNAVNATQATSTARPQYFNRYNMLTYSEDLSNAAWTKEGSPSITANQALDSQGSMSLDLFARTTTAKSRFSQITSKPTIPTLYTLRFECKASVGNYIAARIEGTYPARVDLIVNLSTGAVQSGPTVAGGFSSAVAAVELISAGLYLVTLSAISDTASTIRAQLSANSNGGDVEVVDSVSNSAAYFGRIDLRPNYLSSTAPPYQRVVSSPYALATRTNDYDTSASFPYYSEHDLVDDKLSLTAPALTGQIAIATTRGLWIDDITVSAGTFDLGPTTYTGGPAGLLSALGGQIIGHVVRAGTFTQTEINSLLAYYRTKGCPGLITLGAELVANGDFAVGTGWTLGAGWSIGSGVLTGVAATGDTDYTTTAATGAAYLARHTIVSTTGSTSVNIGAVAGTVRSASGAYAEIMTAGSVSTLLRVQPRLGSSPNVTIDNVSIKALVFPT